MSCESAALGSSHALSKMAKDTLPTTSPTTSSINPFESRTKTAPLPPTPTKNKHFSFPTLHHKEHAKNVDVRSRATTTNHGKSTSNHNEKASPKDRGTSSASTAVPTTAGAALGAGVPKRPTMGQMNRQNSVQTRYMTMLLHLDEIPRLHNILASFFTVSVPTLYFHSFRLLFNFPSPILRPSA